MLLVMMLKISFIFVAKGFAFIESGVIENQGERLDFTISWYTFLFHSPEGLCSS